MTLCHSNHWPCVAKTIPMIFIQIYSTGMGLVLGISRLHDQNNYQECTPIKDQSSLTALNLH